MVSVRESTRHCRNILKKYTMNRSNIYTDEDCFLPLGHGIALMIVNTLGAVIGTFGNILVCTAIITTPHLRRGFNFLLVSLAIADLIVTMVCEPLVVAIVGKRALANDCASSLELVYVVSSNLSCGASIMHLATISVDRFLAVLYPLRHARIMRSYGLKAMLVTSWVVPIIFASLRVPFLKATSYLAFVLFVISYGVIIGSYVSIMVFLVKEKRRKSHLRAQPTVVVNSKIERRVAFTLAIVIGIFSACWFPMIIVFFAAGKSLVKMHGTAYMWIRSLALSNSAMNFIIYSARIRDFWDAYASICRKILPCLASSDQSGQS